MQAKHCGLICKLTTSPKAVFEVRGRMKSGSYLERSMIE